MMIPRDVVIAAGGTVTFNVVGSSRHQVLVFEPGVEPGDVDTDNLSTPAGCSSSRYITQATTGNVVATQNGCGIAQVVIGGDTFDNPGRYLVICAFNPKFL